jgi:hypothetical protein
MIIDGTSNTLLIGEKQAPERGWGYYQRPNGEYVDDNCIYNGDNMPTVGRYAGPRFGLARSPDERVNTNFGGPHPGICQFVFADGGVHPIGVEIDEKMLGYLANKEDEKVINEDSVF